YNFRRAEKKLGELELERITEAAQILEFLEQARSVSERSWQARQLGLRITNDPAEYASFAFLAEQRALRSYLLKRERRPIAFVVGTQFRGRFIYEEVGFDREFAALSPGNVLLT